MKNWTDQELDLLKRIFNSATKQEILKAFPGKTLQNIASRAAKLNLPKRDRSKDINKDDYPYTSHIDNTKHKTLVGLFSWNRKKYNISREETIIQMSYNNIKPTCKCGCGGEVQIKPGTLLFKDYMKGHYIRVHNPTRDNPEIAQRAIAKAKQMWVEGLKNGTNKIWNTGLTKETDERVKEYGAKRKGKKLDEIMKDTEKVKVLRKKISDNMKRRAKEDPNFNAHMKKYWKEESNRKAQGKRKTLSIERNGHKFSKLELSIKSKLEENNILFKHQFRLVNKDYNKVYDFKIKDKDILIEVDGNFWHCNPKLFPDGPIHYGQKYHIKNDKIKNELAAELGYKLLRFWESDIKENIESIIEIIKKEVESN